MELDSLHTFSVSISLTETIDGEERFKIVFFVLHIERS